jgi:hypothetical protein
MVFPGVQAMDTGTNFVGDLDITTPIGHWKLDKSSGVVENSGSAGSGYDGTNNGCTRGVTGKLSNCFEFNGINDYVSIPDNKGHLDFGNGDDFSVFCWVNVDTTNHPILIKYGQSRGYSLYVDSNGYLQVYLYISLSSAGATGTSYIADDEWHHVGLVRDGTTLEAWVDGSLEDTSSSAGGNLANNADLWVGKDSSSNYDGKIDDVRIYDTDIDPEAGLISHWNMDQGFGQTVTDVEGNNNGVLGTNNNWLGETCDPAWTTDSKVGSWALDFTASDNDLVTVPDHDTLDFDTDKDFSIFCWIKGTTRGTLINKHGQYAGYELSITTGDKLYAKLYSLGDISPATGTTDVVDGTWHHVGMVRRGTTLEVWVDGFIDGHVVDEDASGGLGNNEPLEMGTDGFSYYDGIIDDVRIFSEAVIPAN